MSSKKRDDMVAIRKRLLMGDPPYTVDPVMQTKKRSGGNPGLEELNAVGDYAPGAASLRLTIDSLIRLIDVFLERAP